MHIFSALLFIVLAGRAFSLQLVVGGSIGNLTATEIFPANNPSVVQCQSQCSAANTTIADCNDDNCLCSVSTVASVVACEQCMFDEIIAANSLDHDPKAGSTLVLNAYGAACLSSTNATIPATSLALALPSSWDGPVGLELNLPATIVAVGIGAFLGGSGLIVLANM